MLTKANLFEFLPTANLICKLQVNFPKFVSFGHFWGHCISAQCLGSGKKAAEKTRPKEKQGINLEIKENNEKMFFFLRSRMRGGGSITRPKMYFCLHPELRVRYSRTFAHLPHGRSTRNTSKSDSEMIPITFSSLSTTTSLWTCDETQTMLESSVKSKKALFRVTNASLSAIYRSWVWIISDVSPLLWLSSLEPSITCLWYDNGAHPRTTRFDVRSPSSALYPNCYRFFRRPNSANKISITDWNVARW